MQTQALLLVKEQQQQQQQKNMATVTKIGCRANLSQICFQIYYFFIL